MNEPKSTPQPLKDEDIQDVWARQYLIESRNRKGRCDIAGLALTLDLPIDEVRKRYAMLIKALQTHRSKKMLGPVHP
jgi:hypothetical protein